MAPTVIVLALLALGVGIVAFATRRPTGRPGPLLNEDTAWADPVPASEANEEPGDAATAPSQADARPGQGPKASS
jgi:hypothetical protein